MPIKDKNWLVMKADLSHVASANASRVADRHRADDFTAHLLANSPGALVDAKSFRFVPDPWIVKGTNGATLWTISNMVLTYVRATDPTSGLITCFVTLSMNQTASGWFAQRGAPGDNHLRILSQTGAAGLLEDWDTGLLDTDCRANQSIKTYRKDFRPDWYDAAERAQLVLTPGTWHRCYS